MTLHSSHHSRHVTFHFGACLYHTEIPDVEEELREDITTKVAEAPNVRSNRVQALQELDQQIMFQLPTATGDGIDLSLLTNALSPQEKVSSSICLSHIRGCSLCTSWISCPVCACSFFDACLTFLLLRCTLLCLFLLLFCSQVAEPDAHWEFEVLFSDVSSEMQNELEPVDKEEGEEGEEGEDTEDNAGRKRDEADTQAK